MWHHTDSASRQKHWCRRARSERFSRASTGSQRSDNGSADANNQRAGRVFVEFQLTPGVIAAAGVPGATAELFGVVDSIGQGVSGTAYTDGLDLRFLGVSGTDRTPTTLWNAVGVGGDQADIVGVGGSAGGFGVGMTNPNVLTTIAGASAGDFIAFGLSNSTGVDLGAPVGNSTPETYGFQLNQTLGNWQLDVSAVPEPATVTLMLAGLLALARFRR